MKIFISIVLFFRHLFYSGLEIFCILVGIRPIQDAVAEYESVKDMPVFEGFIQMLINNEKYY